MPESTLWMKQAGTIVAGIAGVAAIHATVVVPGILDASEVRAKELMARHIAEVEVLRQQYVTHKELDQMVRLIDHQQAQLDRIELFIQGKGGR